MADKRECYAGDLMSDMLGKLIQVRNDEGVVTSGHLATVQHSSDEDGKYTAVWLDGSEDSEILAENDLVEVFP